MCINIKQWSAFCPLHTFLYCIFFMCVHLCASFQEGIVLQIGRHKKQKDKRMKKSMKKLWCADTPPAWKLLKIVLLMARHTTQPPTAVKTRVRLHGDESTLRANPNATDFRILTVTNFWSISWLQGERGKKKTCDFFQSMLIKHHREAKEALNEKD